MLVVTILDLKIKDRSIWSKNMTHKFVSTKSCRNQKSCIYVQQKYRKSYRDPQLQMAENYQHLFYLRPNICKSWCLSTNFVPKNSDFDRLIKWIKRLHKLLSRCECIPSNFVMLWQSDVIEFKYCTLFLTNGKKIVDGGHLGKWHKPWQMTLNKCPNPIFVFITYSFW